MTPRIRVMVVDDSVVVRRMVSDVLATDPDIEVVATAVNGKVALQRLEQVPVDLVTLDVEMPELDGIATLTLLRKRYPKLPVIMLSTVTSRGAGATIDALSLGANDYVTKPDGMSNLAEARERLKTELIPKIRAHCSRSLTSTGLMPRIATPFGTSSAVTAIAIGVSTGGPPALQIVLSAIPAGFPLPIFIVQHMPASFTAMLATRLSQTSPLPVTEVTTTVHVEGGHVYIAAGDYHLVVEKTPAGVTLRRHQEPPECSCRPSVDVLFRSFAAAYGAGGLAVVLTGMGSDGARGSELIRAQGGSIIVQDQASSVVWGMPGAIVRAGLASAVLPIDGIAAEIVKRVRGLVPRPVAMGRA